jgi:hypothetical protein
MVGDRAPTILVGSDRDVSFCLGLNTNGDLCVCGNTRSADFPVAGEALFDTHLGGDDAFVVSFDRTIMVPLAPQTAAPVPSPGCRRFLAAGIPLRR